MSILDEIKGRYEEGRLQRHTPGSQRGMVERRTLHVATEGLDGIRSLAEMLLARGMGARELERWVFARQYLDDFITAQAITIPPNSRRGGRAFMSRLEPDNDEVWDIRCFEPKRGLRIFGRFAEKDVFVALAWDYRENLPSDIEYGHAKRRCQRLWGSLFPDNGPLTAGRYPDDYITGAVISTDPV